MNPYYDFSGMISRRYQPYMHYSARVQQCYCPRVYYTRKDMCIRQNPWGEYSVADSIRDYGNPINNDILDLRRRGLTSLEGLHQIEGLENVEILLLSRNNLRELPEGIFNGLTNLEILDLSYNQITHNTSSPYESQWVIGLPAMVFRDLLSLVDLDISGNNLYDLPREIFRNQYNLREIDVSNNYFPGTEMVFRNMYFQNRPEINIDFSPQRS